MARISGADRRQQIIEAAHEVILERGLAQAATRDVTRRLGVGSGLLHHYFKSWQGLRAEAVRYSVLREIDDLEKSLSETETARVVPQFIDWLAVDEEMRHWSLWLNAIDEARRDPDLAVVIHEAYRRWHGVVMRVLDRVVAGGHGACADTSLVAWRICALIDGLAGHVLLSETVMPVKTAKDILRTQFAMELACDPTAFPDG
ncbi:TetR/AcrR family transcriptional regulator [Aestuariivita sp.]|jgi:AcrR family transcriptional regulator|uniref:TetR/AcrR family transcriptional regulator n=1 Tax=Aestuariivita sp. TaxID=1872407 RepID=UPI00217095A4|nr:TetR/AcrR family transcriptional regulator [Aestuariivita sp.]MCE8008189.1 TetR/AcrR family transcriptional regulator [Aestuariivita sp.]